MPKDSMGLMLSKSTGQYKLHDAAFDQLQRCWMRTGGRSTLHFQCFLTTAIMVEALIPAADAAVVKHLITETVLLLWLLLLLLLLVSCEGSAPLRLSRVAGPCLVAVPSVSVGKTSICWCGAWRWSAQMQPGRRLCPPRLIAQLLLLLCLLHCPQQLLLAAAHADAGVLNLTKHTSIQA